MGAVGCFSCHCAFAESDTAATETIVGQYQLGYSAFPDICRAPNGDLLVVFYNGAGHVSAPSKQEPWGGKIAMIRSIDEGRTWSAPTVIIDTPLDDRDPSIACLKDGRLAVTWFTHQWNPKETDVCIAWSKDNGQTWSEIKLVCRSKGTSSPIRELSNGDLILGLYRQKDPFVIISTTGGVWTGKLREMSFLGYEAWTEPILIPHGKDHLDAETDVIELQDGRLYAALRCSGHNGRYSVSKDKGRTWSRAIPLGFECSAPYLFRTSRGIIIL